MAAGLFIGDYADLSEAYDVPIVAATATVSTPIDPNTVDVAKIVARYQFLKAEINAKRADVKTLDERVDTLTEKNKICNDAYNTIALYLGNETGFQNAYNEYSIIKNKLIMNETTRLNEQISVLVDSIYEYEKEMSIIRDLVIKIDANLDEADKNKNTCPICFEREVNLCANPCGHTVCSQCNKAQHSPSRCSTCRGTVMNYIKMFFSV